MPSDVRQSRADLRSTLEVDRLTAIRAPLNLTPTTPHTAELRPKIANASHLQHLDPMQACKILYALSSRVVNCRNPNCHCGVLQLALSVNILRPWRRKWRSEPRWMTTPWRRSEPRMRGRRNPPRSSPDIIAASRE